MRILFDSKNEYYKKPFGSLKTDERCEIKIKIPKNCETQKCFLILERSDGFFMQQPLSVVESEDNYEVFSCVFALSFCGLYRYYFKIETRSSSFNLFKYGSGDTNISDGSKWQVTCYDKDYDTPECFKGRVYYQIFPDRFFEGKLNGEVSGKLEPYTVHKSKNEPPVFLPDENGEILNNDFFGGNLNGISEKMGYIKSLGVGVIYLNPIFFAFSNHRYDTADYKKIDPMLGSEADFANLCECAHKNGIKIIIDCAFSHTGSNSIYFDKKKIFGGGAYSDENSPYRSWYSFSQYPEKYTSWWGIDTLPCVNELNESFMNYIIFDENSVLSKWLGLGADGVRLDVADELPDEFIAALTKKVKEIKKDALVMGEVWEDASNKESYGILRKYFSHSELDSVMNYPYQNVIIGFANGAVSGFSFADTVMTIAENYPKPVLDCVMTSLSTHDTIRILTALMPNVMHLTREEKAAYKMSADDRKIALAKEKLCAALQFTLPGCACIYYGDEAGMEGFEDPFNRAFYPWGNEDFSLIAYYKELANLKNSHTALKTGKISFLWQNQHNFAFAREDENENLFVCANTDDDPFFVNCDEKAILFSVGCRYENGHLAVSKNGAAVIGELK
ncbi:MAG: glycoside hydrolase family 13 protein [Clostridia bacterium]|nr:glycoside hydrolase family 13 protein [Clostridia bacterium]